MKRFLFVFSLLMTACMVASAQGRNKVSGSVVEFESNEAVTGATVRLLLFARDQERALACAAGWLATSVWLVAKARPGDSPKWALVPTLCVFAMIAGFHVLWAATPRSWTDPASWTLIASIAETVLASAVLFLRFAIASHHPRRLFCAGVVLATLALWYATGFTIEHYTIC